MLSFETLSVVRKEAVINNNNTFLHRLFTGDLDGLNQMISLVKKFNFNR